MKVRWLVKKYPKPTIKEVKDKMAETGLGMNQCRYLLTKPDEKILQQLVFIDVFGNTGWTDVPTEEIIVKEP